jgi:hypothetical protein
MPTENKNTEVVIQVAPTPVPQEKKKLKRHFIFQGQEYDLNNLTETQKAYLKQFPEQVPFL